MLYMGYVGLGFEGEFGRNVSGGGGMVLGVLGGW